MNQPLISLIVILSENNVIAKNGKVPWHISEDLARFKNITLGHPIIMGRKTYESIGRLLPGRTNIIITRDKGYRVEGAVVVHSLRDAIDTAADLSLRGIPPSPDDEAISTDRRAPLAMTKVDEIFVIGGGQIFEQALPFADKLYLTLVHTTIDGDTHFPDYSAFTKVEYKQEGTKGDLKYTFLDLTK